MLEILVSGLMGIVIGKIFGPTFDSIGLWLRNFLLKKVNFDADIAYNEIYKLISDNLTTNGWKKFSEQKTFLSDGNIKAGFKKYGRYQQKKIKKIWIEKTDIKNYDQSHIFFAGTELLFLHLNKHDIDIIYKKFKDNDQALLAYYLEEINKKYPKFISKEIGEYLKNN